MIAEISDAWLLPANAFWPVAISYSTQPNAKMSVRASASFPSSCSGAMYWNVPRIVPSAVRLAGTGCVGRVVSEPRALRPSGATTFANPKSRSFTPDFVSMTFPGFRSR